MTASLARKLRESDDKMIRLVTKLKETPIERRSEECRSGSIGKIMDGTFNVLRTYHF